MMGGRPPRRYAAVAYGLVAYLVGLASVGYAIGFLANAVVPKTVDAGATHAFGDPIVVNLALIGLFGLQHSLMARPGFKAHWTRLVPEPVERSTYVFAAGLALAALMWGWRPLPDVVWAVEGAPAVALTGISLMGWLLMFAATFMIDGHRLLGLRQVWSYLLDTTLEPAAFRTPYLYRHVRDPIVAGFLVAFWATPRMTVGHLVFAAGMTAYAIVGVRLEERDLLEAFGEPYRRYLETVPRFVPRPGRTASAGGRDPAADGRRNRHPP